jgi:hypothetical protein
VLCAAAVVSAVVATEAPAEAGRQAAPPYLALAEDGLAKLQKPWWNPFSTWYGSPLVELFVKRVSLRPLGVRYASRTSSGTSELIPR